VLRFGGEYRYFAGLLDWLPDYALFEFTNRIIGSLFFIPIVYATIVFWWKGALITFFLSIFWVIPAWIDLKFHPNNIITNLVLLFLPVAITLIASLEINLRIKERQVYIVRDNERRLGISRMLQNQERERRHFAQELHDVTAQNLVFINSQLDELTLNSSQFDKIKLIKDSLATNINDLRRICRDLRPSALDNFGFIEALHLLVNQLNKEAKIETKLIVIGDERKLSRQKEDNLFRIFQEGLNNIRRHSEATKAEIIIKFMSSVVQITIRDNGKGFDVPESIGLLLSEDKLGLVGMKERVDILRGTFKVESALNKGTVIDVFLPYLD